MQMMIDHRSATVASSQRAIPVNIVEKLLERIWIMEPLAQCKQQQELYLM